MASITHGRSLSVLRIWFMASLGRITPRVPGSKFKVPNPISDMPRILAEGHCERSSTRSSMSFALSSRFNVPGLREPLYLIPIEHRLRSSSPQVGLGMKLPG